MSQFENVTVDATANLYFDGKVTSRKLTFADGTVKTLGIMLPGEYDFSTAKAEIMDIQAGELDVLLPGADDWEQISDGQSFEVPADSSFQVKVSSVVDYCCSYLD